MEWVDMKSGKPQMIQGMHTYPSPSTSTQTTEMDLRSGSKDLIVPSLMFMRMLQGTFLPHGKTLGIPLYPDHVVEIHKMMSLVKRVAFTKWAPQAIFGAKSIFRHVDHIL